MLGAFLGLDPFPNPSRQPTCAKLGGKLVPRNFLVKMPKWSGSKIAPSYPLGLVLLDKLVGVSPPSQPHPCCVLRVGVLGMGGCGAELSGQTPRSNPCANLWCSHGSRFPQNSVEKAPFHRQKIGASQQIRLGYLGFFSKSSPMRWALLAGKSCMRSQKPLIPGAYVFYTACVH